jgi:hypothetical protein
MLRTIQCKSSEWIPIVVYIDPYNHPNPDTLPENLKNIFKERAKDWDKRWELQILLSEYLGINEYMLNADRPYKIFLQEGVEVSVQQENGKHISIIKTLSGEMTQIEESGFITKHYIEQPEDIGKFTEYVKAWTLELNKEKVKEIQRMNSLLKDKGMIWNYSEGTPLGMMYRKFADVTSLIYMDADIPEKLAELFELMESKYLQMFEMTLKNCPEIDIIVGIDDTSTSIISPGMFEKYNVALTDKRSELAHQYGKLYMHHSCGLIHDLLPVYRKTKMDGVHAFTPPPVGNVIFSKGRKLLGNKISMQGSVLSGLYFPDKATHEKVVRERMEDARKAGHIMTTITTPDSNHGIDFMEISLEEARKYQKY